MRILTENYMLLRAGIAEIIFIHNEFSSTWLVETFHLSPQENCILEASGKDQLQRLKQKIESRIRGTKQKKVQLMPWIRINGTLNRPLLEKWLTCVLSYCLDFPSCSLLNVFEKFHLVKPVELYFLLEILEHLNCLKIICNVKPTTNLLSTPTQPDTRPATVLDNFKICTPRFILFQRHVWVFI
ncbi:hypothetical protein HHI36_001913 [Cryptolaemus montrouzieri]|uniref:Maturase K n=1 Tax=Cryptolaemus montrouzieri TaxID=559131 RepID=A0ABD2P9R9_9CUCU